jgi:predicted acylesterase/phospholipase RssA
LAREFTNAVFAGGGSRCFWQLGFWDGANRAGLPLNTTVQYAASTSAGCAMALAALLNRGAEALAMFMEMAAQNPRNIHWHNLRPGASGPLLPHMAMYREALEQFLTDADLHALGDRQLEFLMAIPPTYLPGALGPLAAFPVYGLEKRISGAVHPGWTKKMGFRPLVKGTRDVERAAQLVEIILGASCVPPVLPSPGVNGLRVLDGGLIDNVPVDLVAGRSGATLVLLSKRYARELPTVEGRVYVQPSVQIALDKFDYANPGGLQETYELGFSDGQRFTTQESTACHR